MARPAQWCGGAIAVLVLAVACLGGEARASDLQDAVMQDDLGRVQALIAAGADVDELGLSGTALHLATARGSAAIVAALIDAGADLEARDDSGLRPLHLAVRSNDLPITTLLIQRGADTDAYDGQGMTPLILAARAGYAAIVTALLDGGADPRLEQEIYRDPPLRYAVFANSNEIVELLLARGVDIDTRSGHNGETALWWAAMDSHFEVAAFLLDKGADPKLADNDGKTPYRVATDPRIRDLLAAHGGND